MILMYAHNESSVTPGAALRINAACRGTVALSTLHCVQRRMSTQRTAPSDAAAHGTAALHGAGQRRTVHTIRVTYALHCIALWCHTATSPCHSIVSPVKMANPKVMPMGGKTRLGPRNHILD